MIAVTALRVRFGALAVAMLVLVAVGTSAGSARAYPGPTNLNGTAGAGYVSTAVLGGIGGSCLGCHVGTTSPPSGLSINGSGLGTFFVPNNQVANFSVAYTIGGGRGYGGFLIAHNDGTTFDSAGTLGPGGDGYEHACHPADGFPCNGTTNNNTEVMHVAPRPNSFGVVSFPFTYSPIAGSCGGHSFNVWANNVNGDSSCGDTNDAPIEGSFTIQVTCPASGDPCRPTSCNGSGQCITTFTTGNGCDDGQACTYNDTCTAGTCGGTPITCASDDCNTRSCNNTSSCVVTSLNGTVCNDNQSCTINDTCSTGTCIGTPTGSCPTQRPNGSSCTAASQCASGQCVDQTCCNTSCTGQCQACNLPTAKGTCSPVQGQPVAPRAACAGDGTACSGICNGTAATCTYPTTANACRTASCTSGVATRAATCDGKGACPAASIVDCKPYVCAPTACVASCTANAQCAAGYYCSASKCVPLVAAAGACQSGGQCKSGFCVDGVCCDTGCSGQCEACNVTGSVGKCSPLVDAQPHAPKTPCTSDNSSCAGACDGSSREACVYPGPVVTCRAAECSGGVAIVGAVCNGSGTCPGREAVTCGKACVGRLCDTECTSASQCGLGEFCQAGKCLKQFRNGEGCTDGAECASSFCVDSVCCDKACDGQCEACDSTSNAGTCTAVTGVPHGLRSPCVGTGQACGGACDGKKAAACTYQGASKVCAAGKCVSGVATLARVCTGAGACGPTQEQLCSPYSCGATLCTGNCTTSANCPTGNYCSGGVCRPRNPLGAPCASPDQCTSAFCIDGLCCDRACDGVCEACDSPLSTGTCTAIAGPPHGARPPCGGAGICAGTCDGKDAVSCHFPDRSKPCGNGACNGGIIVGAPTCNGIGNCTTNSGSTDCYPFTCAADGKSCIQTCKSADDCGPDLSCVGGACVAEPDDAGTGGGVVDAGEPSGSGGLSGAGGAATSMDGGRSGTMATGGKAGASAGTGPDAGVAPDAGAANPRGAKKSNDDGGCGCRVARARSDYRALWGGLAALAFVARMRRRPRATRSARR